MDSFTDEELAEIDTRILAGEIIEAIRHIMMTCRGTLKEAKDLNHSRYRQLREERAADFQCGEEEYWSGYSECIFDAMSRDF